MIAAILAHLVIGVGALACQRCGQKICSCKRDATLLTGAFLLIEAVASVVIIDQLIHV